MTFYQFYFIGHVSLVGDNVELKLIPSLQHKLLHFSQKITELNF